MSKSAYIELIDSDIQGEDFGVLSQNPQILKKVKRIHIGTNGKIEEYRFRQFFKKLGWKCNFDYPSSCWNRTYIGKIEFVDGVQSWSNPEFLET